MGAPRKIEIVARAPRDMGFFRLPAGWTSGRAFMDGSRRTLQWGSCSLSTYQAIMHTHTFEKMVRGLILTTLCGWGLTGGGLAEDGATATGLPAEGKIEAHLGKPTMELAQVFQRERFPNIVVALDGTVVATFGTSSVKARLSSDAGKTWGEEIMISKPGFQCGGLTVDEGTGAIFAFVEERHPPAPIHVFKSLDHGKSWKKAEVVIKPDSKGNLPSMHMNDHGITLRHGKHAGRIIRPSRWYAGANAHEKWPEHYTNAVYSDDGG